MTRRPSTRPRARDRGSASLEFLGVLPILLLVALAAVQLGLAAYAVQQAGTAARAAARTAAMDPVDQRTDPTSAGRAAISRWVADRAAITVGGSGDTVSATATVHIPSILPGADFGSASRSATMPRPETAPAALGAPAPPSRTAPGAPGAPVQPPRTAPGAPPR